MLANLWLHGQRFLRDDAGATALEYGLIAGFLSILCLIGARQIGTTLVSRFFTPISVTLN